MWNLKTTKNHSQTIYFIAGYLESMLTFVFKVHIKYVMHGKDATLFLNVHTMLVCADTELYNDIFILMPCKKSFLGNAYKSQLNYKEKD